MHVPRHRADPVTACKLHCAVHPSQPQGKRGGFAPPAPLRLAPADPPPDPGGIDHMGRTEVSFLDPSKKTVMAAYLIRRLLQIIPTLIGVVLLVFFLFK